MTLREQFLADREKLSHLYGREEVDNILFWLLDWFFDIKRSEVIADGQFPSDAKAYLAAVSRVASGEPVQYVIGEAPFYGRSFHVDSHVLIPRRETEELVHWIVTDWKGKQFSLVDLGTGSGCIPITVALEISDTEVSAVEISPAVAATTRKNALRHGVTLNVWEIDMLQDVVPGKWDVVVSNPPYVTEAERGQMHTNVVDHEPHLALFVPDEDPLKFYHRIAEISREMLKPGGNLYLEINERFGEEAVSLLEEEGFGQIKLQKDMQGKDRMIRATR